MVDSFCLTVKGADKYKDCLNLSVISGFVVQMTQQFSVLF